VILSQRVTRASRCTDDDRPSRPSSEGRTFCGSCIRVPVDTFFLVKSFVTLVVVIDPVAAVPLFLALTDRYEPRQRYRAAW
jgi:hypothetical protein